MDISWNKLKCIAFIAGFLVTIRLILLHNILKNSRNTTLFPPYTIPNSRENLYAERRSAIANACKKVNKKINNSLKLETKNILIDKRHFIYYCPITKISSSFWKRVLTVMTSQGELLSPFQISLKQVKLSKPKDLSKREFKTLQENGSSFMFVRDPYARLFSGYENKLYHANLWYWKAVGTQVVRVVRNAQDKVYKNYGFDVTFPEFVKYILNQNEKKKYIDHHFAPMVEACDPCSVRFQYIGKMETFTDDAHFLLSLWHKKFKNLTLHFDDFESETVLDTAELRVKLLFESKKILKEIEFPFVKIMLRTWRDLQLRGYLSKTIEFPFINSDVDRVTEGDYMKAVKKALSVKVDQIAVKHQREEAIIQAYRQVTLEDMEKLRTFLLNDLLLFGYDDRPEKLFDRSKPFNQDFLYLDGLKKES